MNSSDFRNALLGHAVRMNQHNEGRIATINGTKVKVGDTVDFKSDTEQFGIVIKIDGNRLTLESPYDSGFLGDYIGGRETTVVNADDCHGLNGE